MCRMRLPGAVRFRAEIFIGVLSYVGAKERKKQTKS